MRDDNEYEAENISHEKTEDVRVKVWYQTTPNIKDESILFSSLYLKVVVSACKSNNLLRYLVHQFFRLPHHKHVTIPILAASPPPGRGVAETNIVQSCTLFRTHHFQSSLDTSGLVGKERYSRWEMEHLLTPVSIYGEGGKKGV